MPGLETLLPLMATYGVGDGYIDWTDSRGCSRPARRKVYNLWPRKGRAASRFHADIVLYDPRLPDTLTAQRLHSAAGYTPYEGNARQGVSFDAAAGAFLGVRRLRIWLG